MSGAVRRRTATFSETVTEHDVTIPEMPRRTKDGLSSVLGALIAVHQPHRDRPDTVLEQVICVECKRLWPCVTLRLIFGDWTITRSTDE